MKMLHSDFEFLTERVRNTLNLYHRLLLPMNRATVSAEYFRWRVFHRVCDDTPGICNRLYSYLNDNHIDTALRQIMVDLQIDKYNPI